MTKYGGRVSVVSVVVAVIGFVLATLWCAVGIAGLTGRLRRNRFVGIRADDTMRSAAAFTVANRAAAPGVLAAAAISAAGAGLTLAVGGWWGPVFTVGAIVVSLLLIGVVSGLGIAAAAAVPDDEEATGCSSGCCSADDAATSTAEDSPAADCGQSSCGSCALSGLCTNEASQA